MTRLITFAAILLGACASRPVEYTPLVEQAYPQPAPAPVDGAIFHAGQGGLFEDRRARRVGDMLTVLLVERTQAQKSASTSTAKDSSTSIPGATLLGGPVTRAGIPVLENELASNNSFEGGGDSSQSNRLDGQLTVIVTEVYPNGALKVAGDKRLEINRGAENLRLTGLVRAEDIAADNTVPSSRVAMADISYRGSGPVAEANAMGWLTRFFQSPLWPF